MTVVVDTNVILIANGQHSGVSAKCVAACAVRLNEIVREGRIAIDDRFLILSEYKNKTSPHIGKRAGDAFVKWALRVNANSTKCDQVVINDHAERTFVEFPSDERLRTFDRADCKFVAVARAHGKYPPVLQGSDAKWLGWRELLKSHKVDVEFLCADDIKSFRKAKVQKPKSAK